MRHWDSHALMEPRFGGSDRVTPQSAAGHGFARPVTIPYNVRMDTHQRVLFVDATSNFYRIDRYAVGDPFFGPVDLGLHLAGKYHSLNIGAGLLAGSILPGSNRLVVTGYSPAWDGFYVSTMGGAALVFDNLGINMLSLVGRAPVPSVLYLNRKGGEHIEVELTPIHLEAAWDSGAGGIYGLMQQVLDRYGGHYETDPRILGVGRAAAETDFGALGSAPIKDGRLTHTDTWAGRGGFGSRLLQRHNVCAIIYGGTFVDEDFRDRKVADQWFVDKYEKKLMAVDFEATTKYRFDPGFETGGTLGVNYAKVGGRILYFNYRSIFASEEERLHVHERVHRQPLFETVQPGDDRAEAADHVWRAVCRRVQEAARRIQEGLRALPDDGSAGRSVRSAGRRTTQPPRRHVRVRCHLGGRRGRLADGMPGRGDADPGGTRRLRATLLLHRGIRRRGRFRTQRRPGDRNCWMR